MKINMFHEATRSRLPTPVRDYLLSANNDRWHKEYAKSYRDALAHRIPPYIPPATFTSEEELNYQKLEIEKGECIMSQQWTRVDSIWLEQESLGSPCFTFLHSFNENSEVKPLMIHPQILSDAMTVTEFGKLFLRHWLEMPAN